jgi:phenylalanyl-tRNA synthetase alpha chain
MEKEIKKLLLDALQKIEKASTKTELENLRISHLGKKGKITLLIKGISQLSEDKRKTIGKLVNEVKRKIISALSNKERELSEKKEEWLDVTAPGKKPQIGHLHPVTWAIREIVPIFERLGFSRTSYPEVELDYYAFESLNMPRDHPARDEWETFFITPARQSPPRLVGVADGDNIVLTPHTSSGQVREMEKGVLPIKMLNIAKCYRRQYDVSHTPMFHQFEGLYVDKNVSIPHLFGTLDYFVKEFFGPERRVRLRPFHFQFTEPSFETDVSCGVCEGRGCKLCKEGWLELGGAGMVHPKVLQFGKIDPKKHSGFAFGWGVERVYMMKEGLKIPDIRMLYENDIRFLEQF